MKMGLEKRMQEVGISEMFDRMVTKRMWFLLVLSYWNCHHLGKTHWQHRLKACRWPGCCARRRGGIGSRHCANPSTLEKIFYGL